jgi:IS5 family transposase
VKVPFVFTIKEGILAGLRSMRANPWDDHTMTETLEQVSILNDRQPERAIMDKGYQDVEALNTQVLFLDQKCGINTVLRMMFKGRSDIEPKIRHLKTDGRLDRNPLKHTLGDALHEILCDAGQNIRLLLKKLAFLFLRIWHRLLAQLMGINPASLAVPAKNCVI